MLDADHQLEALLADPSFQRILRLLAHEVMTRWNMSWPAARGLVLSAIGEPAVLAGVHEAWFAAGDRRSLAKLIVRRRILDLLGKDARPRWQTWLPAATDLSKEESPLGRLEPRVQHAAMDRIAKRRVIDAVHDALDCFATQGTVQRRQAHLLQRYDLDEVAYAALSAELGCSITALRVRVHKARAALLKHIRGCHPELEELFDVAAWIHST
jgi:DNA-directed RNA polymerase specialized sigma24 family protein